MSETLKEMFVSMVKRRGNFPRVCHHLAAAGVDFRDAAAGRHSLLMTSAAVSHVSRKYFHGITSKE